MVRRPRGGIPLGWQWDPVTFELVPHEGEREGRRIALAARRRNPRIPLALISEMLEDAGIRPRDQGGRWDAKQIQRLLETDPEAYGRHTSPRDVAAMARIRRALRDRGTLTIRELVAEISKSSDRNYVFNRKPEYVYALIETLAARGKVTLTGQGLYATVRLRGPR